MNLSVVIPTYNRSALLRRTLTALAEQSSPASIREVLVVSDGSTDATPAVVAEFDHLLPVRLISAMKSGVSAARNLGLSQVRAPVVLLLDDDVVPSPELIQEHCEFHRNRPELEAVLLGYVTWLPELRITPFMQWYGEYGALFGFGLLEDDTQVDRRFLYTCNISFKTEFLRVNGGLNEKLTVYEDHELGHRLTKKGMRMFFRKSALGYHNQSFTFVQACERMLRYSSGLNSFLATEAGKEMAHNEQRWKIFLKRLISPRTSRPSASLQALIDSGYRLPATFYRFFYWYFATLPAAKARSVPGPGA